MRPAFDKKDALSFSAVSFESSADALCDLYSSTMRTGCSTPDQKLQSSEIFLQMPDLLKAFQPYLLLVDQEPQRLEAAPLERGVDLEAGLLCTAEERVAGHWFCLVSATNRTWWNGGQPAFL